MGGIVVPWIGMGVRPVPSTGPVSGGAVRPMPGGAVRPMPGGGISPPFPVSPGYPSSVTRPAAMENGQAVSRQTVTARKAEENARNRKRDCRCLPSVRCEGKPFFVKQSKFKPWVEYQLYIANMKASFAFIHEDGLLTEWSFGGYNRWDGFWQGYCTLIEAKGRYDWIDRIKDGERIWESNVNRFVRQLNQQEQIIIKKREQTGGKDIKLEWHFKEKQTYDKFNELISMKNLTGNGISVHYTPFEDYEEREERRRKLEEYYRNNPDDFSNFSV